MPFESLAQEGWAHSHPDEFGRKNLAEFDAATKGKHLPEHKMKNKKGHSFSHTHIEHHHDGSHTVHHVHESDAKKDVKHAVPDLDGAHDSMEEHLGMPNAGEETPQASATPPQAAPAAPMAQ
jgi:hypothetical protein